MRSSPCIQLYVLEQALDVIIFNGSAIPTFHASAKPIWVYGVEVFAAVYMSIDVDKSIWNHVQRLVREHKLSIKKKWVLECPVESKFLPIVVLLSVVVSHQEPDSSIEPCHDVLDSALVAKGEVPQMENQVPL